MGRKNSRGTQYIVAICKAISIVGFKIPPFDFLLFSNGNLWLLRGFPRPIDLLCFCLPLFSRSKIEKIYPRAESAHLEECHVHVTISKNKIHSLCAIFDLVSTMNEGVISTNERNARPNIQMWHFRWYRRPPLRVVGILNRNCLFCGWSQQLFIQKSSKEFVPKFLWRMAIIFFRLMHLINRYAWASLATELRSLWICHVRTFWRCPLC